LVKSPANSPIVLSGARKRNTCTLVFAGSAAVLNFRAEVECFLAVEFLIYSKRETVI